MSNPIEAVLVLLILSNLMLLASGQLGACIRIVAIQGVLLGLLPVLVRIDDVTAAVVLLSLGSICLKGLVFPWLLSRALREASVAREVEPFVGYGVSLLVGVLFLAFSVWVGSRLTLPDRVVSPPDRKRTRLNSSP